MFVAVLNMEINDIMAIVGSFGAVIGLKELLAWFVKWFVNRKTENRKEDASADNMELDVAHQAMKAQQEVIDTLREESKRKSGMIADKDKKIDDLYVRLRDVESNYNGLIVDKKQYELDIKDKEIEIRDLKLKLQAAEYNRCDLTDNECSRRIPPRRKSITVEPASIKKQ